MSEGNSGRSPVLTVIPERPEHHGAVYQVHQEAFGRPDEARLPRARGRGRVPARVRRSVGIIDADRAARDVRGLC